MKKILFYCQYLTGMGHLVRSTEIIRYLAKDFHVYFINGGVEIPDFEMPTGIEVINLPALYIENGQLTINTLDQTVEEVKEARKNQLINIFDTIQPDCLITEFFPFGRHKLCFELLPLLNHIKSTQPDTKIICSVRDIIGRTTIDSETDFICQLINQYFDLILYHSDPKLQLFEDTFPEYQKLACPVEYTGLVAQNNFAVTPLPLPSQKPMIILSVGGGRLGYELIETAIQASHLLYPNFSHTLQIFTGPFMPEEQSFYLQNLAANQKQINLEKFTPNLLTYLQKADLSISLTGYNTIMNILRTKIRSLVVPIGHYNQDQEQYLRTEKLEKLGIVEVIQPEKLTPQNLAQNILDILQKPLSSNTIFDLNGAPKTAVILKQFLSSSLPQISRKSEEMQASCLP